MTKSIIFQLKRRVPIVSILLMISCLISTLPQFFLNNHYSDITGQVAHLSSFYLFTLSSFTHSPDILTIHLVGNLLVFLVFGVISEIIIGSRRFALISMVTFLSTTIVGYLHTTDYYVGHGASGIAWGYHIFYIFILIVLFEHQGKKLFKDPYIIASILLLIFDVIGIPVMEVMVLKRGFFDNFGQVLHLVSMIVVVPFIFKWRVDIETSAKLLVSNEQIIKPTKYKSIAIIFMILLVILNVFGTYKVINLTQGDSNLSYVIEPESKSAIENIPQKIIVKFDREIKDAVRTLTSITYDEEIGKVEVSEIRKDAITMEIEVSRRFQSDEKIKLNYEIIYEIEDGISMTDELVLEY